MIDPLIDSSSAPVNVVGIDWATQPRKVGLALGLFCDKRLVLRDAMLGSGRNKSVDVIRGWIKGASQTLICIDAPLGWPLPLRMALMSHSAGKPLRGDSYDLFMRATDRRVWRDLEKRPLEVGADRIARTAKSALDFLEELAVGAGRSVEIAWHPARWDGIRAIEVYPAATCAAWRINQKSIESVSQHCSFGNVNADVLQNPHVTDAILCAIAGSNFLCGLAAAPSAGIEKEKALQEGWIWAPSKKSL
ncbi:DUF429 domain-containing protein [Pseudoxanthomonas japonensis]|uniref:DUF429 domain-containing protein n=1 Tax=Pseudoxanthomonas japonensis TaxID=69284 RepID=UPI001BD186F7|nr:DUF429 domain-containing protein [Pseudoxanthomonas japonensis]MCR6625397.1 DUF429 domain-containing protein [Pseudoxanthomonas sp.]